MNVRQRMGNSKKEQGDKSHINERPDDVRHLELEKSLIRVCIWLN